MLFIHSASALLQLTQHYTLMTLIFLLFVCIELVIIYLDD